MKNLYSPVIALIFFFLFTFPVNAATISVYSTSGINADSSGSTTKIFDARDFSQPRPEWLAYNCPACNNWPNPHPVWGEFWINTGWTPSGQSPGDPAIPFFGWYFMNPSGPQVIQSYADPIQPSMRRDFVRKQFTLPTTGTITKAILYSSSDNLAKYWLNGTRINSVDNSLDNGGCQQTYGLPHAGWEGGVWSQDVTSLVNNGDNILSVNNLNYRICDQSHPMGVQFYLWINIESPTGSISGKVFKDVNNNCDSTQPGQEVPGQSVQLSNPDYSPAIISPSATSNGSGYYVFSQPTHNLRLNGSSYTLDATNTSLGRVEFCRNGVSVGPQVNLVNDFPEAIVDIGFVSNDSWLNVFDGDVYGEDELSVSIPPSTSPAINNWLINKSPLPNYAGGVGISGPGVNVNTHQITFAPNRTSERSAAGDGTEPGWEVNRHPEIKYLTKFKFQNANAELLSGSSWTSALEKDRSYRLDSWVQPGGNYNLTTPGVATVYVNGAIDISSDIVSSGADKGLIIITDSVVTIRPNVTRIDAVIISFGVISAREKSDSGLNVNGALYTLGGFDLTREFTDPDTNRISPAITVNFKPLYLTNLNPDLIKYNYFWEELPPQ